MKQLNRIFVLPAAVALITLVAPAFAIDATSPVAEAKQGEYIKPNVKHESYGAMKIVIPITTDDKGMHGMKLRNLSNSLTAVEKWGGKIDATIVLYAKGLSLLKSPDEAMQAQIDELKHKGVRIEICNNSLSEQGIDFHSLYQVTDKDIVPSGFAEVAYLQTKKNYVVDPAN
jgi:intracellular sulfur oxidation DsrE/DsrF family protein